MNPSATEFNTDELPLQSTIETEQPEQEQHHNIQEHAEMEDGIPIENDNLNIDPMRKSKYEIFSVGKKEISVNLKVIDANYTSLLHVCEPRPEKHEPKTHRPRTPWTFGVSIWAREGYSFDDEPEVIIIKLILYRV